MMKRMHTMMNSDMRVRHPADDADDSDIPNVEVESSYNFNIG